MPTPNTTAVSPATHPRPPAATAPNPPTHMSTTPGTLWCTWWPPEETSWNGPFPARIIRVTHRVATKVTMNATSASNSGSFPASTMSRYHQSSITHQHRRPPPATARRSRHHHTPHHTPHHAADERDVDVQ